MKTAIKLILFIFTSFYLNLQGQTEIKKTIQLSKKNSETPDTVITKIPMVPPDFSKNFNTPFVKPNSDCSFSMPVLPNRGNNPLDTPALKYKPFKKKKGIK